MNPFKKISNFFNRQDQKNGAPKKPIIYVPKSAMNALGSDYETWLKGNLKGILVNDTADVKINAEHLYRGYGYGIIRSVVNSGIIAAEENIRTTCSTLQREILAQANDQIEHPYKKLWQNSPYFSEYQFWKKYLTYIQLKGEFYIYMNRKQLAGAKRYRPGTHDLCGKTAYMKIINPYEMSPKTYDPATGEVTEWLRTFKNPKGGKDLTQTYPAYQIIRVAEDDPWNEDKPYSLLDATKENLFTLENARDYTRHALVNNINAPGLLAVEGEFQSQEEFDNYIAMLQNHKEGEIIVAAGNAKSTYQTMDQNLDGASQEKIRGIERDEMFISSGVSKSVLGVETTGLTRDVAATQKLTFTERTVVPYIRLMLETLNFDYRTKYAGQFALDKYILHITIPSVGDKTQEMKELEIREEEYSMVQRYVDRGYTRKSAAQYVRGEIDVEQLQLEKGDKARMSSDESVSLVTAAEKWEALISAGNDPQSVVDLIDGKITMAEFIEKNKDNVKPLEEEDPTATTGTGAKGKTEKKTKKKPGDYYDPDPADYSTPRDQKDTPADKSKKDKKKDTKKDTKKDKKNQIAIEVIMHELKVDEPTAQTKLESGDLSRTVREKIQQQLSYKINTNKEQE